MHNINSTDATSDADKTPHDQSSIVGPGAVSRLGWYSVSNLVWGKHLSARTQGPVMPERVSDDAIPLAPEHLGNRHLYGGAHLHGMFKGAVDIVELEQQHDRRSA